MASSATPPATSAVPAAADPTIAALRAALCDETTPLPVRFRALFSLKHLAKQASEAIAGEPENNNNNNNNTATAQAAIDAIAAAFASPSALLKHELAYCLGQTGNVGAAGPALRRVLADVHEDTMCRHEAAEALGALGAAADLDLLRAFRDRADEAALARGLAADPSALFRHEVAFVFGQLAHPASIPALTAALSNPDEASMVRHEAAEALGSLGDEAGVEATLRRFLHDKERVVRESIVVALDMAEYEQGGETEYALIPEVSPAAPAVA
ncbi:deoxyhypusine hydroxylase [Niveomyces insectorum RCEF 264]|uniref:Deoxyhypusine hydroxylase n=1 Tax=Niveomyces insectorum RCEF 264 TaxID=1081102 RepID=A0A167PIK0_9HYPO|nr:deoxyhypusine hydroxylase [Niveomyces insectorum RCEF 264]